MPTEAIIKEHKDSMQKTVDHLKNDLRAIRTGRASPGLVENLMVDYYGTPTPLKQMANILTPDASSIAIKPFDPVSIKDIGNAIKSSELSLSPLVDGKIVRLNIPPLSEERRKQIVGQVKQMGEKTKVSIRNIRRDANKHLDDEQKNKTITEDDRDKGKKNADDLTKSHINMVDEIIKTKSEEIMSD